MTLTPHLRIARPVSDLARACAMYCRGLDAQVVSRFAPGEDGIEGAMLALPAAQWHLELTQGHRHTIRPTPTVEDLLVLYVPDAEEWRARCAAMFAAGFRHVASYNPYWDERGRTFEDPDGYRTVIENAAWSR